MHLLTPDDITLIKKTDAQDVAKRTHLAAEEEAKAIKELRTTQTNAALEINALQTQLEAKRQEFTSTISILKGEVAILENQRAHALKPTIEREQQATLALQQAQQTLLEQHEAQLLLASEKEALIDVKNDLFDQKVHLDNRCARIDSREAHIANEETRLKQAWEKLNNEWIAIHAAEHSFNATKLEHEQNVSRETQVNEIVKKLQDTRASEQYEKERALRDGYAALEQAKKHLGL